MKSFIVLAPLFFFGVVISADITIQKLIHSIKPELMGECLIEFNLENEMDKMFIDETTVDLRTLICLLACTTRKYGVLVNGELQLDVLEEILSKISTEEDKLDKIMALIKSCIPEGANEKNDCDYLYKIIQCEYRKAPEMGF